MGKTDSIAVLDFGGQYAHLIANRIRRLGVYSRILRSDVAAREMSDFKGVILSGGPSSVLDEGSPRMDPALLTLGIPVLGLCYGHQLIAQLLGGEVGRGSIREYGIATIRLMCPDPLFGALDSQQQVWMSHGDSVTAVPPGFETLAASSDCPIAAMGHRSRKIYGMQFHPEVADTPRGMDMLANFLAICGCERTWTSRRYLEEIQDDLIRRCAGRKVFLLVSGGVDSTVAFTLLNRTLGPERVLGLHINNGLMRHDESETVAQHLRSHGFDNLVVVDAAEDFLNALRGVTDPERKRAIIGAMFLEVKQRAQEKLGLNAAEWLLAQGTIYPDTIESAGTEHAARIKTHHNRVDVMMELIEKGLVVEPLAQLYKDEVRELGETLGLSHRLVWRHPFPGPGLGVRALCSNNGAPSIDARARQAVAAMAGEAGYSGDILPVRCVGVQGDSRTYAYAAVVSGPRDWDALERLSTRMTNSISYINRVVYALRMPTHGYRPVAAYLTRERLELLRRIDHAVTEALYRNEAYDAVWQMPVVLLPLVNDRGEAAVVLRPVRSQEAMTARFARLSDAVIEDMLQQIASIPGAGPALYDITHKPPGTIEWE